jgi:Mrp family chromosome partitioning ATPase/capsular polysaccharide biosynthesis protein
MGAAALYLHREAPNFESVAAVQLSIPAQGSSGTGSPTVNTSTAVVTGDGVVRLVDEGKGVPFATSVSASFNTNTDVMYVSGQASTPEEAQSVANAYAKAYVRYQQQQANAQIAVLEAQQKKAMEAVNQLEAKLAATPAVSQQLLEAQVTAAIASYQSLSSQVSAAQLAGPPAVLSQAAGLGGSTLSSDRKVLGVAAVIGLIAGSGIALVRAQLDTRLRGAVDIEGVLELPFLVELPYDRHERKRKRPVLILDRPQSSFAESIRELRTAVQVLLGNVECPVVVVTSPEPSDGKTFVAVNLAASWALSGKRIIVVSGDLRRPRIERLLGAPPGASGVATLIEGALPAMRRSRLAHATSWDESEKSGAEQNAEDEDGEGMGGTESDEQGFEDGESGDGGAGDRLPKDKQLEGEQSRGDTFRDDDLESEGHKGKGPEDKGRKIGVPSRPTTWKLSSRGPLKEGRPGPQDRPSRSEVMRALVDTEMDDLVLIPAGPSPNDPADLLAGKGMQVLIARLKELADLILIDSPPVLAVADSTILGTYADGVVIVARAKKTTREALEQTAKRLSAANVRVLGVALNRSLKVMNQAYPQYHSGVSEQRPPTRWSSSLRRANRYRTKE